jgi:hypothetical protein
MSPLRNCQTGGDDLARSKALLRAVGGLGLDDLEMDTVVTLINGYVAGAAHWSARGCAGHRCPVQRIKWT